MEIKGLAMEGIEGIGHEREMKGTWNEQEWDKRGN